MDRSAEAAAPAPRAIALRPDKLVRLFFGLCVLFSIWLAVSPIHGYLEARDKATDTRQQLQSLQSERQRLQAQSQDLSRGTGLEEQARRQGLIDPSERSYVIEGMK